MKKEKKKIVGTSMQAARGPNIAFVGDRYLHRFYFE